MKKIFLIVGGLVSLLIVGAIVYFGYPYFLLYQRVSEAKRQSIEAYQAHLQQQGMANQSPQNIAEAQRQSIEAYQRHMQQQGTTNQSPQKMYKAVVQQGPQVVDDHGYKSEDNWIATSISREIADMAFVIANPGQPLQDLKVTAVVDSMQGRVHIDLEGWGNAPVSVDVKPLFAWDGQGYAPFARQILGNHEGVPAQAVTESTDVVSRLLNLTGAEIAREDVWVSDRLQRYPASWADHETAALVLVSLALRENAGKYQDNRLQLNRATAHLALAKALRGDQPETWPGLIAEAAILTLSGREQDAVSALDGLASRPECSPSAKVWIDALRLTAKQNWLLADINADSPLLLKILWFQVVAHDLPDMAAAARLDKVLGQDGSGVDQQVPDWGRAIIAPDFKVSVENGERFTQANMPLEFQELDEVLKTEGAAPLDQKNLGDGLSEPEGRTISPDADGKPSVRVVGSGVFKAATRRHLFNDIKPAAYSIGTGLGLTAKAETFHSEMNILFRGVPQFEFVQLDTADPGDAMPPSKSYPIEEAPVGLISEWRMTDDYGLIKSFYSEPAPFGTAYQVENRSELRSLNSLAEFYRNGGIDPDEIANKISRFPADEQGDAHKKFFEDTVAHPEKYYPPALSTAEKAMLVLAPYEIALVSQSQKVNVFKPLKDGEVAYLDHLELNSVVEPFLEHNLRYLKSLERWDINDADHAVLLRKQVLFEPDAYFELATILRVQGKEDEAAEMDRKGVAQAHDQVGMSNSVRPLLLYDLDHGHTDEALSIGKRAADVYSSDGLESYLIVLEKLGRLNEAEEIGKDIEDRYQNDAALNQFYWRNRTKYPEKYDDMMRANFPDGLTKVDLASFSGRPHGAMFEHENTNTLRWGIHRGDVIVAIDGHKVESVEQYYLLRGVSFDPHMDLIIWKDQEKYVELKVNVPTRQFGIKLDDF